MGGAGLENVRVHSGTDYVCLACDQRGDVEEAVTCEARALLLPYNAFVELGHWWDPSDSNTL